jgi:predicted N-formylglutamate amidohydrolase
VTVSTERSLLDELDGPAVLAGNTEGNGPFLIVCDHASNRVPVSLGTLGLDEAALQSHAAWDPGAYAIALKLARLLDAPLVHAAYSRLVYDVNRPPDSSQAIRETSEIYDVPGNRGLSRSEREARANAIYYPFHARIAAMIDERTARSQDTVLIDLHSFTPVYHGEQRDVQLGILHDVDSRLADAVLTVAPQFTSLKTGRNTPYGPQDGVTHTLAKHAIPRGLLNVMIEIRNDLIAGDDEQTAIAETLAGMLASALESFVAGSVKPLKPGVDNAPSD